MNATLNDNSAPEDVVAAAESVEFNLNILVLGYMAITNSAWNPKAHWKHWGSEIKTGPLRFGNDRIVITRHRLGGVLGISFQRHIDHFNGGQDIEEWFIPFDELEHVKATFKAVRTR